MAPFQSSTICFSSLCLFLFLPFSVLSQTDNNNYRNISLGSSLTTDSNALWASPSGEFAFGFRQITTNGYLLAIVFNQIPERTVVWSANRNNLLPAGSKLELTAQGRLVLTDPSGSQIWTPNANGPTASHAAMLDTGNFVLVANNSSGVLWESFQDPTDTLLPTQTLERDSRLVAKRSTSNHSESRFQLIMQEDGNLVMYQKVDNYPWTPSQYAYWDIDPSPGYRVEFNESGFLRVVAMNGTLIRSVFNNGGSGQDFYHRVTLDYDGVLRYYEHPKRSNVTVSPKKWDSLYFEPSNICTVEAGNMGSGACGYNSFCELENRQYPKCKCPPGYIFQDPSDEGRGCIPDFDPVDCRLQEERTAFDLVEMPKVDWPLSSYELFQSVTEEECQQSCLSDCRCALVVYDSNRQCWKKRSPLSNGRVVDLMTGKSLIKVRRSNSTTTLTSSPPVVYAVPDEKSDNGNGQALFVIGLVMLASSAFMIVLVAIAFIFLSRQKKKRNNQGTGAGGYALDGKNDWLSRNLRSFSYCQLELATGGFKEVLGSGASGTVYKGVLLLAGNQQLIAVKRLDKAVTGTMELEFETEVKVIGGANHKNLVKLVGFCNEGLHRVLVYEFMNNGSLASLLFGEGNVRLRPSWYTRTHIACAVAKGLVYLHEECSTQIIHCDVKPQNILLDESMRAKISDFGLSKLLKVDQTRTMTGIRGTKGYVAPEWFRNMPVTAKVDVYSFGILLLELVSCRSKLEMEVESEDEVVLADWAYECYREGQLHRLVENDDEVVANMEKVERYVKVAIWCIQDDPSLRPKMNKVVHMLEGSVHVSAPPDPASFISAI